MEDFAPAIVGGIGQGVQQAISKLNRALRYRPIVWPLRMLRGGLFVVRWYRASVVQARNRCLTTNCGRERVRTWRPMRMLRTCGLFRGMMHPRLAWGRPPWACRVSVSWRAFWYNGGKTTQRRAP